MINKLSSQLNTLNEFRDKCIANSDIFTQATINSFLNIFASTVLEINRHQVLYSLDSSNVIKSNSLKNVCLNWLMEFMGMLKTIANRDDYSSNNVKFSLEIFCVYIYCLSFKSAELFNIKSNGIITINSSQILSNLKFYLNKLMKQSHWKQIHKMLVDWFISVFKAKNFPTEIAIQLKGKFCKKKFLFLLKTSD